jgi:hypothetical protein
VEAARIPQLLFRLFADIQKNSLFRTLQPPWLVFPKRSSSSRQLIAGNHTRSKPPAKTRGLVVCPYSCYVMCVMSTLTQAEAIRRHLNFRYIAPARDRGEKFVTVTAGDIHRELGLRNRVPNVCQVMESRLLEREARVKVSSKQGPPSGRGTTFTITYAIEPAEPAASSSPVESESISESKSSQSVGNRLFYELRGLGKETFAALGGGDAFLHGERAAFYKAAEKARP